MLAFAPVLSSAAMQCPSTSAFLGACGMKLTTTAAASCDDVLAEMKARVAGQYGAWYDPHNNGTYAVESYGGTFSTSRVTGNGKYTDKQIFTLTDADSSSCTIEACSRSQVTSYLDMGTNYCDLEMLICGSDKGCKPVLHDFSLGSEKTEKFAGSTVDMGACLAVARASKPAPLQADQLSAKLGKLVERTDKLLELPKMVELPSKASIVTGGAGIRTTSATDEPCCKSCEAPLAKYYSVDVPHGFCGETCMDPSKFWIFKIFESNLTVATDNSPCAEQFTPTGGHYTDYTSTVTHGFPGLKITLDLYGPSSA